MKVFYRIFQFFMGIAVKFIKIRKPVIISGADSFSKIPEALAENGCVHPFVVTDQRLVVMDFFNEMISKLENCTVFSDVEPNPTVRLVERMVKEYNEAGCDALIAIGGGSNIDAAKACGARISKPAKSLAQMGGTMRVLKKQPLFIAVPTTAGTGSECTIASVITDEDTQRKYAIQDPVLVPRYAVLDAKLTTTLPPGLTATTGMDALTHAVEAYLHRMYHLKETPGLCIDAVKDIVKYLPTAYCEPLNIEARDAMLMASHKAGRAFTIACVGNVHAMAHTLGGFYHVAHGLANAVILPYVLEDYGEKVYKPLAELARESGVAIYPVYADVKNADEAYAKSFIAHIRKMNADMNIPSKIEEIKEEDLPLMAKYAAKEANPLYPVPVIYTEEHFIMMLKKLM